MNSARHLSILAIALFLFIQYAKAQAPDPALVGYFHNWQDANAPYVQLDQVDSRYNIIDISFAVPQTGTDYKMEFIPDQVSQGTFISQIQTLQSQGRKVLISIGGATAPVSLDNAMESDTFVSSMLNIISTYGFDGIDIDLEGSSISTSGGTIAAPIDQPLINLIDAIKQIMGNYYSQNNKHLILTMAPEAAFVQGGQSAYGGIWGGYLPVIDALRDSLDVLHVQLYNTGSLLGIDGNIYVQGTADFIVAMCEAVIQGFNTGGGMFNGLPANKIAVGLPACPQAAGGGFTDTASVKAAINYLRGMGPRPGSYILHNSQGYPGLRGMMTWSINWDAAANCNGSYEYALNYENIFGNTTSVPDNMTNGLTTMFPNPANTFIKISNIESKNINLDMYNSMGRLTLTKHLCGQVELLDVTKYSPGIYFIRINNNNYKIIIQHDF